MKRSPAKKITKADLDMESQTWVCVYCMTSYSDRDGAEDCVEQHKEDDLI